MSIFSNSITAEFILMRITFTIKYNNTENNENRNHF